MKISKIFCPVISAVLPTCKKVNGDKERLLDIEMGFGRGSFSALLQPHTGGLVILVTVGSDLRGEVSIGTDRKKGGQMDRNSIFKATSKCFDTD